MNKRLRDIKLAQTEALLAPWRSFSPSAHPQGGWAKTIREALGMTASSLARRLGMSPAGLRHLEQTESEGVITLASLRKLGAALDCELRYALVPRSTLGEKLKQRALEVAQGRLSRVSHSMALEAQGLDVAASKVQLELLAQEVLDGSRRELW